MRECVGAAGFVDDDGVDFRLEQGALGFEATFCVGEGFRADLLDACFDFFEVIAGLSREGWEFGM